nr:hypothetical protein [Myxococcota bacterium]
ALTIAPWLSLRASGSAGARLATILAGTAVTSRGRLGVSIGEPLGVRLVLSVEQHAYVWVESPGVMLRSTIDARLDFHHAALQVALHRHDGDQNVAYFFYVFPNTTMTIALTGRL